MKKVLFTATMDVFLLQFQIPYLKLFKEKGYQVYVSTNNEGLIPYTDIKYTVPFDRNPFSLNNIKAYKQLKKLINKEHFDIIHCHNPIVSILTRLAARKSRKKYHTRVIYTAHGFHFYNGAPKKNWLIYYNAEKLMAKYTDTLITMNKEDYSIAKKKFKKRCKDIEYVAGVGIDETRFNFKMTKKEKKELKTSLGLKEDDFVLIFPARVAFDKNQGFLIDAMEELIKKDKKIKLLLPGEDEVNGYFHKLVKEKKLTKYIKFLGYREDIPKLLRISDLSVSSSVREGLPVHIMEAYITGLPVIALKCRGVSDMVSLENGFMVNTKEEFIEKVRYLKDNPHLRKIISKNNKEKAKKYYIENILKDYKKIYKLK